MYISPLSFVFRMVYSFITVHVSHHILFPIIHSALFKYLCSTTFINQFLQIIIIVVQLLFIFSGNWGKIILPASLPGTMVHNNSASSSAVTKDISEFPVELETEKPYQLRCLWRRYILILYLQAPLQIDARQLTIKAKSADFFYDIGSSAGRSGIIMYRQLGLRYRYDYTASTAATANLPPAPEVY